MRHTAIEPRCEGCFLKPSLCICALLPRIETRTHVTVIMHKLEHGKTTNTGRLAVRCLPNSAMVLFGNDGAPLPERPWPAGRTPVVLFPVAGAQPVEDFAGRDDIALIALDANWRQAARLRKRFAAQNIPFAKAPAGASTYRLRHGPHEDGMSTLEAVARSVAAVDGVDVTPLLYALEVFQDRLLWLRGTLPTAEVTGGIPEGLLRHLAR